MLIPSLKVNMLLNIGHGVSLDQYKIIIIIATHKFT